jgi:hypothetical protein
MMMWKMMCGLVPILCRLSPLVWRLVPNGFGLRWWCAGMMMGCFLGGDVQAKSFHLIVCGSGGEEAYVAQFEDWGQQLRRVLVEQLGHLNDRVYLLTELGTDANGVSSLAEIKRMCQQIGKRVDKEDDVFVYLIGHGSYRQNIAKLNIVGADLTADQLHEWIQKWSARQVVVINAASTSAAFMNVLSGPGRIICTSTRNVEERNATQFMAFFIQALAGGSADQNRDERISVLEVCQQAGLLTDAWYAEEGYLATEHALLDDNGDGKGTRLTDIVLRQGDGKKADQCFLLDIHLPLGTSKALGDAYLAAISSVQVLIEKKTVLDSVAYGMQLEQALLKAARINRQIREKNDP